MEEAHQIVETFIAPYNLQPVNIRFGTDIPENAMGATKCGAVSNTCEIVLHPCILNVNPHDAKNLVAHEAAHYVNAQINRIYDHGIEWKNLMRDQGWRPQEFYEESRSIINACGEVDI